MRWFGVWVENKLYETHPITHERLYELSDLLDEHAAKDSPVNALIQMFGVIQR